MKREYSRPTVEKLHFNYRDQVVAASGDVTTYTPLEEETREQFIDRIMEDGRISFAELMEIVYRIFG